MKSKPSRFIWVGGMVVLASVVSLFAANFGKVPIQPATTSPNPESPLPLVDVSDKLDPLARYGGSALTENCMPHGEYAAYLWAKNLGTLVAYETYIRRYPEGGHAAFFKQEIRTKFLPEEEEWHEAWKVYSKMEVIEGAICDPKSGFILIGRPGTGRLPPFLYEDLITALKCVLAKDRIGVTMSRIFKARNTTLQNPTQMPGVASETSVEFYSKQLWNTHLGYILFEGDRMLKSLDHGYDLFLREPVRSKLQGFATVLEMAALEPVPDAPNGQYGRVWIELTTVKINTTEEKNVAMFSDVELEVRAESKYPPMMKFAKHLRENYAAYGEEFPIFAEVERAARLVAIARWLAEGYPDIAQKLVDSSYENIKVFVPQVIAARYDKVTNTLRGEYGLIGGVVFPNVNRTTVAKNANVADTPLVNLAPKVIGARNGQAPAWELPLGAKSNERYSAWCVSAMRARTSRR